MIIRRTAAWDKSYFELNKTDIWIEIISSSDKERSLNFYFTHRRNDGLMSLLK